MAANTSPDNITYPVSGDAVAALETVFATMASSVQTALTRNGYSQYGTLAALQAVTGSRYGQHATVYADSTAAFNTDYYWNGTAWAYVVPIVSAGSTTTAASGVTTVTFPTNRFTVAPIVTAYAMVSGSVSIAYTSAAPTSTNFGVRTFTLGGAQVAGTVYWQAVQMTPTTAAG